MKKSIIFALMICAPSAFADGFYKPKEPSFEERLEAKIKQFADKELTILANKEGCDASTQGGIMQSPNIYETSGYVASAPKSFKLISVIYQYDAPKYVKVRISDGTIGYISTSFFDPILPSDKNYDYYLDAYHQGCLFAQPLNEVIEQIQAKKDRIAKVEEDRAKEKQEYEAAQEALAKKPNARIGMTREQVLNHTNWGEPDYINTTTNRGGKLEQWVYEGNQYLYFKNGRLISIQN